MPSTSVLRTVLCPQSVSLVSATDLRARRSCAFVRNPSRIGFSARLPRQTATDLLIRVLGMVYFVIDRKNDTTKIGVTGNIPRRLANLQTGNSNKLELMGWITPEDDHGTEKVLHKRYKEKRVPGGGKEWFAISQDVVLRELQQARGFIPRNADSFEIIGYDQDGIPEYMGVYIWADFECDECCPFCGCFCGMYFNEAASMYHCLNCDTLSDFSEPGFSHQGS